MLSSKIKKVTAPAKGDTKTKDKTTSTSQPSFTGRPFTLQEPSEKIATTLDEAQKIVGLGIQLGTYEAAGEGLYRMMTRKAVESHEKVANRVKSDFKKLVKYEFLGKEVEEEFKKDMKYLKMEGWDATWI